MMEKLKQYVDSGQLEFAKMRDGQQPQKVPFQEVEEKVNRQNYLGKLYKSLQSLDWDEKYEWVHIRRLKGNEFYKNEQFDQAIETYMESLVGIDLHDNREGHLEIMKKELKFPITLNIATCMYRKKEFQKALALCDKVLDEDDTWLAAVYKKAFILFKLDKLEESKLLLDKGIGLAKQHKDQKNQKTLKQLRAEIRQYARKNQEVYKKIFNPEEDSEQASLLPNQNNEGSEEVWEYQDPLSQAKNAQNQHFIVKVVNYLRDCVRPSRPHLSHSSKLLLGRKNSKQAAKSCSKKNI